jgi:Ca2+ transporting ATPase
MESAWTYSASDVLSKLKVDPKVGLTKEEVATRREKYGSNKLEEGEATPLWKLILAQFQDQLVLILLASAVISFVLALLEEHESLAAALVEPAVIFLILIANATVGVIQERNADQAIEVRAR